MRSRFRPSPAMIVACLALAVALGGSAYAVTSLPKNSVGAKQLKAGAVTTPKIKNGAVTGPKVKTGSLGPVQVQSRCPAGLAPVADVCFDRQDRHGGWLAALSTCRLHALRLPTLAELDAVALALPDPPSEVDYWTSELTSNTTAVYIVDQPGRDFGVGADRPISDTLAYRCVTSLRP